MLKNQLPEKKLIFTLVINLVLDSYFFVAKIALVVCITAILCSHKDEIKNGEFQIMISNIIPMKGLEKLKSLSELIVKNLYFILIAAAVIFLLSIGFNYLQSLLLSRSEKDIRSKVKKSINNFELHKKFEDLLISKSYKLIWPKYLKISFPISVTIELIILCAVCLYLGFNFFSIISLIILSAIKITLFFYTILNYKKKITKAFSESLESAYKFYKDHLESPLTCDKTKESDLLFILWLFPLSFFVIRCLTRTTTIFDVVFISYNIFYAIINFAATFSVNMKTSNSDEDTYRQINGEFFMRCLWEKLAIKGEALKSLDTIEVESSSLTKDCFGEEVTLVNNIAFKIKKSDLTFICSKHWEAIIDRLFYCKTFKIKLNNNEAEVDITKHIKYIGNSTEPFQLSKSQIEEMEDLLKQTFDSTKAIFTALSYCFSNCDFLIVPWSTIPKKWEIIEKILEFCQKYNTGLIICNDKELEIPNKLKSQLFYTDDQGTWKLKI